MRFLGPSVVSIVLLSCSSVETNQSRSKLPPTQIQSVTKAALVGQWSFNLSNGDTYHLSLFESGVMGFQHVGPKLPISRAFGTWSVDQSKLRFSIAGHEPDEIPFPLPLALSVGPGARDAQIVLGSEQATWQAATAPYGKEPGASARHARDERDWTHLVERAEDK